MINHTPNRVDEQSESQITSGLGAEQHRATTQERLTAEDSGDARLRVVRRIRQSIKRQVRGRRTLSACLVVSGVVAGSIAIPVLITLPLWPTGGLRSGNSEVAATIAIAALGYAAGLSAYCWLYTTAARSLHRSLDLNEPGAAGCVAWALKQKHMPRGGPYFERLAALTEGIAHAEWEMMTRDDVASIVSYGADKYGDWAARVGLVAVRSAVLHGELRAIPPLRQAITEIAIRWDGSIYVRKELQDLLANLEAQAAQLQSTNTLLRPADDRSELLRAAAETHLAGHNALLVTPTDALVAEQPIMPGEP